MTKNRSFPACLPTHVQIELRELAWHRDIDVPTLIEDILSTYLREHRDAVIAAGRAFDQVQDFAFRPLNELAPNRPTRNKPRN